MRLLCYRLGQFNDHEMELQKRIGFPQGLTPGFHSDTTAVKILEEHASKIFLKSAKNKSAKIDACSRKDERKRATQVEALDLDFVNKGIFLV